jgi:hypothetical protein
MVTIWLPSVKNSNFVFTVAESRAARRPTTELLPRGSDGCVAMPTRRCLALFNSSRAAKSQDARYFTDTVVSAPINGTMCDNTHSYGICKSAWIKHIEAEAIAGPPRHI